MSTMNTEPQQETELETRYGSRILAVHGIGHDTDRGVPVWFFICDLQHPEDSPQSASHVGPRIRKRQEVSPIDLCHASEKGKQRVDELCEKLSDYLQRYGRWLDKPEPVRRRPGCLIFWKPRHAQGYEPLGQS